MFGSYNLSTGLILQNAIHLMLNTIGMEINSHATCIISNGYNYNNEIHLNHLPAVRGNCQAEDKNVFINHQRRGVANGCSFFIVCEECALSFLNEFHQIHDWVDQKYAKKVLVVIDTQRALANSIVLDILNHQTVINDIPLTLVLQPNINNEWIFVWSGYPNYSNRLTRNRFFLQNSSFEYDEQIIPHLVDLNGLQVTGAFINYPPYTSYDHVVIGTGNSNLVNSNESRSIHLDGQECIILVEFCVKYNCTLTARLDYDEELWGESFDNMTGHGLIGALTIREANVSVAAMYLWESQYKFTQYSSVIQKAVCTKIVPKPLPLPYWLTPLLPFPVHIWSCVIGSLCISALILFAMDVTLTGIYNRLAERRALRLFESFYDVFKMTVFQSVEINVSFLSNVTIFATILTFALIIGNLYCGGLSSVMTITRYEIPVDRVERLVESKFIWGGTTFIWMDALQKSEYEPHKKLIKYYKEKSIPELTKLVKRQRIAVTVEKMQHGTLSYQSFLDNDSAKHYMIMKHSLYWQYTVVMASKTWPYMEQLNRIVLMQQESGIRYYWEYLSAVRLMDYDIQQSLEENGKPPKAGAPIRLSVEHILGALFVLLFGNVLASVFFVLEILYNYFSHVNDTETEIL